MKAVYNALAVNETATGRRSILLVSVTILSLVALLVTALALYIVYNAALAEQHARLTEVAQSRARIIEAVARFDARHSVQDHPGGAAAATLSQIADAHECFAGFGDTGEFVLARREGNRIVFLLRQRHNGSASPESVPFTAEVAEPMRQALSGKSGTLIGVDYRGETVLAAHEPVSDLNWGVVAKIDLTEIRAPFVRAALMAAALALLAIAAGASLLKRLTSPLIRHIEQRNVALRTEIAERNRAETELAAARTLLSLDMDEAPADSAPLSVPVQPAVWRYFHAIALDYDGTITDGGRPGEELLNALREQRDGGRRILLVTGRILAELRHEFFDVEKWFDIIVAENGAVIRRGNISRTLAPPVSRELDSALQRRGVPFRRGQVLLAFDGKYDSVVFEELRHLGLDSQIIHNRGASMLLPAGVTKASGLLEALDAVGVSAHSTIAVGDSENDLALFEECELSVAVANSIESLKSHADLVLEQPSAVGVLNLLRSPLIRDESRVAASRRLVDVGLSPEQQRVTLPASQINLLITGGVTGGKSYAAGLLAEQLIALRYSLCIIDPEGDYVSLALLRGVTVVGGEHPLPSAPQLAQMLRHNSNSMVIDMSQLSLSEQNTYAAVVLKVVRRQRARNGTPHWIFADEAHVAFGEQVASQAFVAGEKGYCMVTFKPEEVFEEANIDFDFVLLVAGEQDMDPAIIAYLSAVTHIPPAGLKRFVADATQGHALLVRLSQPPELYPVILGRRTVHHVRHRHKYASSPMHPARAFHFRDDVAETGWVAGDFDQFHAELLRCDKAVLSHHARGFDFSRWIEEVMSDSELAKAVHGIEKRMTAAGDDAALEEQRRKLLGAVSKRYLRKEAQNNHGASEAAGKQAPGSSE